MSSIIVAYKGQAETVDFLISKGADQASAEQAFSRTNSKDKQSRRGGAVLPPIRTLPF